MSIFEAHFRRLHARYGAGQTHELQMQEIAAIFGCSVRNCRIALKKMHQEKWLDWQPQRGRGKRSRRHCCKVSDEAAFCLIQRPYISKTLLTRRISPRGSP
ncbi:SgrR family transcriptional regulator [Salmonella enterica]